MVWKTALKEYKIYLTLERGLSSNSIASYTRDVEKLILFLHTNNYTETPLTIHKTVIQQFIYEIAKVVNPRSQSRIISGLKSFFSYLMFEEYCTNK